MSDQNFVEDQELEDTNELQLAENSEIEQYESIGDLTFVEKRALLEKTKIVKQTWSILEIYQKIKSGKLILSPEYQRNSIWKVDKQTAFIESLFMDILVPPIYVVEVPGDDVLEDSTYEVVDGKQRLTAIHDFIINNYSLDSKTLEYFADLFSDKKFTEIQSFFPEETNNLLSSVLDIYVITANSPEFTKYDIFSRLNKGSEKLKVNEIRKAIYRSSTLKRIEAFTNKHLVRENKDDIEFVKYNLFFTQNDIQRYEDYGRFYRSIAFYVKSKIEPEVFVEGYNSRPREMINIVLQGIQLKKTNIPNNIIDNILNFTLDFGVWLTENKVEKSRIHYIIDSLILFNEKITDFNSIKPLLEDENFNATFEKSVATTTNVNERLRIAYDFVSTNL
ncbi:DUF262 domain-containing protein [Flavobacterium aquidurense]|uniref:DUF262 domain-containing protein n=1 Tax=Flavobacterium aquidurense TaxID=362413 RepID=UPI002854653C|nr:DUF262 domain-containing protein [Flavobacterium aquidurense]MDR7371060.1 hypothetical protein [Flavobacterium aquidurense]